MAFQRNAELGVSVNMELLLNANKGRFQITRDRREKFPEPLGIALNPVSEFGLPILGTLRLDIGFPAVAGGENSIPTEGDG